MADSTKKSKDILVTQGMFDELRGEFKSSMTSMELEVKSVKSELKADIDKVRSEVTQVRSEVEKIDSKLDKVLSAVHRVTAIVEEQRSQNRYVLDGYAAITDRQDRFEQETKTQIDGIEKLITDR